MYWDVVIVVVVLRDRAEEAREVKEEEERRRKEEEERKRREEEARRQLLEEMQELRRRKKQSVDQRSRMGFGGEPERKSGSKPCRALSSGRIRPHMSVLCVAVYLLWVHSGQH